MNKDLTLAAIEIIQNEYDNAEEDGIKGACAIALKAMHRTILFEDQLTDLEKLCKFCKAPMYTTIRAHHHTENGVDVTV